MKVKQFAAKLKRLIRFIIYRRVLKIEFQARYLMMVFGMVLATATVIGIFNIVSNNIRLILLVFLILYFAAGLIVFISDLWHSSTKQTTKQKAQTAPRIEHSAGTRWLSIGLMLAMAIIVGLIFLWRQLPATPERYQAFFTAFAGIGAWVTGISLAAFAYQQYKLRQTEHNLLFNPQLILTSGIPSIHGLLFYPFLTKPEPYQIEWHVIIQNTSQIPILIQDMEVCVRLVGEESGEQSRLTPSYCHIAEPDNLTRSFEVNLNNSKRIVWIIEGSAGDVFDWVSRYSDKRDFVLIFRVFAKISQDSDAPISYKETVSWPIHVPKDANWVSKTPFLDKYRKEQEGDKAN